MTAQAWQALLLPELRRALPEIAGKTLTLSPARPSLDYTNSRLHFFSLVADGRLAQELAVKELRGAVADGAQTEFAGMSRLWAHLAAHPHVRAPRPLFWLARPPALVMESVRGQRLNRVLAGCRRPQRKAGSEHALAWVRRAGEALSLLHQIAPAAPAVALVPPAERAEDAFRRLHGLGVAAGQIATLRRQIEALPGSLPPSGPTVALHGDFTLRNLLCAANGMIYILDTSLSLAGPPAHDVGYFLAALAFIDRWQLLAGRLAYPPAAVQALGRAFLSAYGPAPSLEAGHLALFTVLRLLERWGEYAETVQANRSRVARLMFDARLHRHFAEAVAETLPNWDGNAQDRA